MSEENVQIFKTSFEAWNAGNMDAVRELYHPDAILRPPEGWPESEVLVGREAVMRGYEQVRETWDFDASVPISDYIDAADRVVVRASWRGVGHGPESTMELTLVATVREEKMFGVEFFWDHA